MPKAPPPPLLRDRRLFALLALGALLRLWIGLDVRAGDPTATALLSDSLYYMDWAAALAGGPAFAAEGGELAYWMPPLYPQVIALLGGGLGAVLVLQGVLGLLTTALVVALGERMLSSRPTPGAPDPELDRSGRRNAALLGGLVWTLYGPLIFFEGRVLGATLATALAALGLLLAAVWRDRHVAGLSGWVALAASGLVLGLMVLTRPNTLLALPVLTVWVLWLARGARPDSGAAGGLSWPAALGRSAAFALAALAPLLPALAHNHAATDALVPVTVNGGVNFYFANNPESHGTFHAPGIEWGSINAQRQVARDGAAEALGVAVIDDVQASRYWFGRGVDYLLEDPVGATRLWGLKLADLVSSTEFGIQYNFRAARHQAPSLWLVSLPFGALLLLAALGWRRTGVHLLWPWVFAGAVSALLYFTYSRFRLPLLPPLMPFAGLGLLRLVSGRIRPAPLAIGLILAGQSFLPFEGSYPRHLRSKAFVDMARASDDAAERLALLDQALAVVPGNKPALVERALVHLRQGNAAPALADLEAAAALPVDYPLAELQLASLLARSPEPAFRDVTRARAVLETWLARHDPSHPFAEEFRLLLGQLP